VFSFKLRGAFNKMAKLPKEALQRGVITSSAGNHAQGVALAASKLVSWHTTWAAAAFHSHVSSLRQHTAPVCSCSNAALALSGATAPATGTKPTTAGVLLVM
jgi:threonine dehydratase